LKPVCSLGCTLLEEFNLARCSLRKSLGTRTGFKSETKPRGCGLEFPQLTPSPLVRPHRCFWAVLRSKTTRQPILRATKFSGNESSYVLHALEMVVYSIHRTIIEPKFKITFCHMTNPLSTVYIANKITIAKHLMYSTASHCNI
jgi:hypothetical protein